MDSSLGRIAAAAVLSVLLSAGNYSQDSGFNRTSMTIVAFGDSTTAPRTVDGKPLAVTASILGDRLRGEGGVPKVINAGVPGNSTADARRRFEADVLAHRPDVVVIQFGINDSAVDVWRQPPATRPRVPLVEFDSNLRYFVGELRRRSIDAILMTPNPIRWTAKLRELYGKPPYDPTRPDGFNVLLADYVAAVRRVAHENAALVDVYEAFEAHGRAPGRSVDDLLLDGMHPNATGHALIADLLAAKIAGSGAAAMRRLAPPPRSVREVHAPVIVGPAAGNAGIHLLPDGRLKAFLNGSDHEIRSAVSTDGGLTWSEPRLEFKGPGGAGVSLLDRDGEFHVFMSVYRRVGAARNPGIDLFIDVWHARTRNHGARWSTPRPIFEGYCGAQNAVVQLRSGRIVFPFGEWIGGRPVAPPTGAIVTAFVYSDDGGETWRKAAAQLTTPCYTDYNGNNYGADEPVMLEKKDGTVWLLMRSQTGYLYEAFSRDGIRWSEPRPSPFYASTGPPGLLRVSPGRILVFWNNCELPPRLDGAGVYGGRDALHAAISEDEGRTWRGFREVYRDPGRNDNPPGHGDLGTAYPYPYRSTEGKVILVSGQGAGRRNMVMFDPAWLLETRQEEDFARGLDAWGVFKPHGPSRGWFRDRVQGPRLIPDADRPGARVLHLRRPDDKYPDGALWNFPLGPKGTLTLRIRLQPQFAGAVVSLTDRFFNPEDPAGEKEAVFMLPIGPDGRISLQNALQHDRWYTLRFDWDVSSRTCVVSVDGEPKVWLKPSYTPTHGISYLRLRSTAERVDPAGFLVESVKVDVTERRPARP
jgi:lysophospholipase L1-like esterase